MLPCWSPALIITSPPVPELPEPTDKAIAPAIPSEFPDIKLILPELDFDDEPVLNSISPL
jgi:hypothetical protein